MITWSTTAPAASTISSSRATTTMHRSICQSAKPSRGRCRDLQPGTYTYYCAIPGHRALMEGTITITGPETGSGGEEAPTSSDGATPSASATPAAEDAAAPLGEPVELSAPGIAWSTNEITIARGGTIHLVNEGAAVHDFTIDDPAVSSGPVEAGQTH